MSLNIKKVSTKNLKSKGHPDVVQTTFHINRNEEAPINSALFRDIYNGYEKKFGAHNVLVRAVNNTGMMTLKGFGENDLMFLDFHQYYQNRVKDPKHFYYFYSLEITVRT
jgi:hypothetical protein